MVLDLFSHHKQLEKWTNYMKNLFQALDSMQHQSFTFKRRVANSIITLILCFEAISDLNIGRGNSSRGYLLTELRRQRSSTGRPRCRNLQAMIYGIYMSKNSTNWTLRIYKLNFKYKFLRYYTVLMHLGTKIIYIFLEKQIKNKKLRIIISSLFGLVSFALT